MSTDVLFTRHDIPESIKHILGVAYSHNVIDLADVFMMGMNQAELEDWEQWDSIVDEICEYAFVLRATPEGQAKHKAVVTAAELYWAEKREAAADSACEYTGPDL